MEIKVVKETKKKIIIEVKGSNVALCNAIKKELWNDSHVTAASVNVEHPLVSNPKIIVETDGKEKPKTALEKAVERLKKQNKDFSSSFKKEVK